MSTTETAEVIAASHAEVRAWARTKGIEGVGTRGPVPRHVGEAFNKAHRRKKFGVDA